MASTMEDTHASTVNCKTILNAGLQLQGKDQLNKQMQEWQRRMDAHKHVERAVTANKLTFERNIRMMEMGSKQGAVSDQQQYTTVSDNTLIVNNSEQIMVPIFFTVPSPLHFTFQSPQEYFSGADYLSSCNEWLQWHQIMPPTPYMRSAPPMPLHQAKASYDPSLMQLDYLPFSSEDEISNSETDSCIIDSLQITCDSDEDDDEFNVIL